MLTFSTGLEHVSRGLFRGSLSIWGQVASLLVAGVQLRDVEPQEPGSLQEMLSSEWSL